MIFFKKYFQFLFQFTTSLFLGTLVYMVTCLVTSFEGGLDGLVVFGFYLLFGIILTILTIAFCIVLGLPIRLCKRFRDWWRKNWYISLIGMITGLICYIVFLVVNPQVFSGDWESPEKLLLLGILGWIMLIFFCLHLYWPSFKK